ncbi:TetR/AcrR family transcriptional regulator [Streptosporangium sandarakinum]|uniref:TetR/AcrR family transcriptional regulator n=1 Tax=Streptosporangium sandarakinum TaxID=1260955 RepID=UPI00339EE35F
MSRSKGFDPDRVLDAAMDAFWNKGYAATSAQDLVDHTGLGRGSLYNAFSNKHHLFLRVLRRYEDEWTARQVAVLEGDGPVRDRIRRVLMTVVEEEAECAPARRGCLAVNAAVELAGKDPDVTACVRRIFGRMEGAFREALERARRDGEIGADRDPAVLARYLLNSMYGLRVLGKTADRSGMTGIVETTLNSL